MKHVEIIQCTYCQGEDLRKNGHSPNGTQRWHCKGCNKFFQREFTHRGRLSDVKEQIIDMTLNGSGIRNIARSLRISPHTVINEIKKNSKRN